MLGWLVLCCGCAAWAPACAAACVRRADHGLILFFSFTRLEPAALGPQRPPDCAVIAATDAAADAAYVELLILGRFGGRPAGAPITALNVEVEVCAVQTAGEESTGFNCLDPTAPGALPTTDPPRAGGPLIYVGCNWRVSFIWECTPSVCCSSPVQLKRRSAMR